ncbi:MAG: hypothetical protein ACK58L_05535 [Planctomycetota bacterium]
MKGPSLPVELRVLRVFHCQACGRRIFVPGSVTSYLCSCSDPPKFMQPQERPVTKSPDVAHFLSPAEPRDLEEEPEVELEPYVPFVPVLPQRPGPFSSRRKLSDEIEKFVPAEFGDGVDSVKNNADADAGFESADEQNSNRPSFRNRQRPGVSGNRERAAGGRKDRHERRESRGELRGPAIHPVSPPEFRGSDDHGDSPSVEQPSAGPE